MEQNISKFVVAREDLSISNEIKIEENDVGIIETEEKDYTIVFFIRIWNTVKVRSSDYELFEVNKTGDQFPKKICNICHKLLDTTEFSKNQNGINNRSVRRPSCRSCRTILEGMNMKPKDVSEWLKSKPVNVPFECPICGKRTIAGVTSKIVLDHDHITGKPRAWICDSCNTGIGRFKDDVALLQRAIEFLGSE